MANYSPEIDTLIRAYFRGKLTEMEQQNFENRLQTDSELSEAFALEQENRHFFKAYTYYKLQEAHSMIQALEKANPLVLDTSENTDNQPNASSKKWFGLSIFLIICLFSAFYIYSHKSSNKNNITPPLSQNVALASENRNDSAVNHVIEQDAISPNKATTQTLTQNNATAKKIAQNNAFADSMKLYFSLEKRVKNAQNELVVLLQNNFTINQDVIDTLETLTKCEHQQNNFSLAEPKFRLLADSLVLDSIRLMQVFPPPPQDISTLQSQKAELIKWEILGTFRKNKAFERNRNLKMQLKRFTRELKACRE